MHIVKLDAIGSTNSYLKSLSTEKGAKDMTVVVTDTQTDGRGQRGAVWETEPGKNLTFSLLKYFSGLGVDEHAKLNCLVALAIFRVLQEWGIPNVRLKWPNDIMSGNQKICGILVENMLRGNEIASSIIGIGLNVNQANFRNLPKATSIYLALGKPLDLEWALRTLVMGLRANLETISQQSWLDVRKSYEEVLYKKDTVSIFSCKDNVPFNGIIKGITKNGELKVLLEDDTIQHYAVKQIRLHA